MATIERTTRRTDLRPVLADLRPFQNTTGSLRGEARSPYGYRFDIADARLNDRERARFYADDDIMGVDFVVWSYATPIAWKTPVGWYVVDQKFSATTSNHQAQVRRALSWVIA